MGLFSKLFGAKEQAQTNPAQPQSSTPQQGEENKGVSFMLLYGTVPHFQFDALKKRLESVFGDEAQEISGIADGETVLLNVKFGHEEAMVATLPFPYPSQILDSILPTCHFPAAEKQKFYTSKAHILLSYKADTTPAHTQYDRLYRIAGALAAENNNAIGIVNESAMTAHPAALLEHTAKERAELLQEKSMPFMSWLMWTGGCVKYILDENTIWFVTKGNHVFGLPEFAFKGNPNQGNSSMEIFNALFAYQLFYNARLAVGHTAEIGSQKLKFTAVTEYKDMFEGKYGTLVINFL